MHRKSLVRATCPIARSLERVGEWWSMLILRDVLHGVHRFHDLQGNLGIAPNMLTRRLASLVDEGLLERRAYSERPKRYEYRPTARARDFEPVLVTLLQWGNRHFAPEGESVVLVDAATGKTAEPLLVDANTGLPITPGRHVFAPGPAASDRTRRRYAKSAGDASA